MSKPIFHQSMLSMLSRCGMQFRYRYIDKIIAPPGVAMVVGTATHRTVREDLAAKRDKGHLLEDAEIHDLASDSFEEAWGVSDPLLSDDEREQGAAMVRGGAKDQTISLCLTHHVALAPEIKPYRLEEKIEIEFDGAPFDVGGTIDLTEQPEPGKRVLRDTKTSAKKISPEAAAKGLQLQFYSMMIEKGLGEEVVGGGLDVVQKKPLAGYHVPVKINKNYDPLMQRLEAAANVVEKEAFYPVDPGGPSGWACSKKFCGYWGMCPYGEKR